MNVIHNQIHIHLKEFESALTDLAWSIVGEVFEEQRKKLASGLMIADLRPPVADKRLMKIERIPSRELRVMTLLDSKIGSWSRGGGIYRVVGQGKKPKTFDLENIANGKKINATFKTLASRWKHTP